MKDISDNTTDTMCGIDDDEMTYLFRESVRLELEAKKVRGLPIAKYNLGKMSPASIGGGGHLRSVGGYNPQLNAVQQSCTLATLNDGASPY